MSAMNGKVVIVTGGFGVLGSAVAHVAAKAGAKVAAVDIAPAPPEGLFDDSVLAIGGCDLTNYETVIATFAKIAGTLGQIDALLNIAGGFRWQKLADGALDTWDKMYAMNLRSAATASKAVLPLMKTPGGAIVNVSAGATLKATTGMGAYTASKLGVIALTESLAEELKDTGIRVNAVMPSIIDTPANRKEMPDSDFSRWVTPEALADAMLFLASDEARAVTGAKLAISGRV
jgi:NAD(P)-dependent dehydrogenase (short-subunit alcohol dehydrogenase family)